MSLRDKVREWVESGYTPTTNPLVSKRLVLKNLNQILNLLEDDCPSMATERIQWLITDIESDKLKAGEL